MVPKSLTSLRYARSHYQEADAVLARLHAMPLEAEPVQRVRDEISHLSKRRRMILRRSTGGCSSGTTRNCSSVAASVLLS